MKSNINVSILELDILFENHCSYSRCTHTYIYMCIWIICVAVTDGQGGHSIL